MTGAAPESYSRVQKTLHWAIAALVLAQYVALDGISRAFGAGMREGSFVWSGVVVGHVVVGVLILGLTLWRLGLRLRRGAPAPVAGSAVVRAAAGAVHWAFYGVLIAMAVSGGVAWFGQSGAAAAAHLAGKTLLLGLVAVHVGAALFHQFWRRDGLIGRMV